jgi:hypothetical protein
MSDKEVLKKLLKIAENQQKIITKLAQAQSATPIHPNTREAETILEALPASVRAAVAILEVHQSHDPSFDGEVQVKFVPGKGSDAVFAAVQKTVENLVSRNLLNGASYAIKEVA